MRLEAGKKMLNDKSHTAKGVARALGFANVQGFSLLFKKSTGESPNRYKIPLN